MVALAQILGYLKLYELPQGGSITLSMLPIFFFAVRWGLKDGLLCSFVFGILQLLLDGGFAIGGQSMLGDYILAFGVLGLAGLPVPSWCAHFLKFLLVGGLMYGA